MKGEIFYRHGLNFACARCSGCCRYESGFVFLSETDLSVLVVVFNMSVEEFTATHCRWVPSEDGYGEKLSLKEIPRGGGNFDCIFWKDGCSVYKSRPLQCRTFPFWDFVLEDEEAWNRTAAQCPGMGKGELHSFSEIQTYLKERRNHPIIKRINP
ncbi:MAG: YkgJ family cysteine cluster protein [Treponema sp.]|jgi:Fe-S-cluster containining protein|nr:YkgJ family cysteine cluster protein [Treponema sp.]